VHIRDEHASRACLPEPQGASRRLLAYWTSYCLILRAIEITHPKLDMAKTYAPALNYRDLQHAVLGDGQADAALLEVAGFLRLRTETERPRLFVPDAGHANGEEKSLRLLADAYDTAGLLIVYKRDLCSLQDVFDAECKNLRQIEVDLTRRAETQQQRLSYLRDEQKKLTTALQQAIEEHRQCRNRSPSSRSAEKKVGTARQRLSNKDAEINAELNFTGIVHRLPKHDQNAKRVLFLLHLPPCFQHLTILGIEAQAKLQTEMPEDTQENWTDIRKEGGGHEGSSWSLKYIYSELSFYYTRRPMKPPTQSIDSWTLEDSITYPSGHAALPFGSNVFDNASSMAIFQSGIFCANTEREELEAAVNLSPGLVSLVRGNESLASQFEREAREQGWSRPAYHAFWAVRADPNLQLRRVTEVFQEKDFPLSLSDSDVQTLLRMTVFHTGPLEANVAGDCAVARANALDLEDENFLRAFVYTLQSMSAQLGAEAQKTPAGLQIVAELLAYLASRQHLVAIPAAREIARAGEEAANSVNERLTHLLEVGGDPREERRLEAVRQTLLCHCLATIDAIRSDEDAGRYCRLLLLARAAAPSSAEEILDEERAAKAAFQNARRIAARVLPSLLARLPRLGEDAALAPFLTRALLALRDRTRVHENKLKWVALAPGDAGPGMDVQDTFTACFEAMLPAETHDGVAVRCSVNLASGESLINGLPPGRVPEAVTEAPNYQRIFEGRNFKVDGDGPGVFRTMHDVGGRAYRFAPALSMEILPRIFELSPSQGDEDATWLELLPTEQESLTARNTEGVANWDSALPTRLSTLYSAWHVPGRDCVLLRGPFAVNDPQLFNKRHVAFVVTSERCYRPHSLARTDWRSLVCLESRADFDELIACPHWAPAAAKPLTASVACVLRALAGVERTEYIHVFRTHKSVRVELPRFGPDVAFLTDDDGNWRSCERPSYVLASAQLLSASLRGFGAYISLHLEPKALSSSGEERLRLPSRMLLMLEGDVVPGAAREWMPQVDLATVNIPPGPDDEVRLVPVSWDEALARWSVDNVRDRIQLAAVLAYSHTPLPESTGLPAAHALELIRASAFEHLDEKALHALANCQKAAWGKPSLQLRCSQLQRDAAALSFCVDEDTTRKQGKIKPKAGAYCDGAATSYYKTAKATLDLAPQLFLTTEEARQIGLTAEDCQGPVTVSCPPDKLVERIDRSLGCLVATAKQDETRNLTDNGLSQLCTVSANAKVQNSGTALARHFAEEAERSKRALHSFAPARLLSGAPAQAIQVATECLASVTTRMTKLEANIHNLFGVTTDSRVANGDKGVRRIRLARVRGRTAPPSIAELLRLTWQREQADALAPPGIEATDAWYAEVRRTVLSWAQLLACRQRLRRIQTIARMASNAQNGAAYSESADQLHAQDLLLHELQASRLYDVGIRPWWLSLEISGNLAIRPKQMAVTLRMRHHNCANVQLNMGEGKSSVILPLLMLDFAFSPDRYLPRAIFPPALLSTGVEVLRRRLTQGPARLPVIPLLFQRNAQLDRSNVGVLERLLFRAICYGGIVAVAPNDVLSMHLKCDELELVAGRQGRSSELPPSMSQLEVQTPESQARGVSVEGDALRYVLLNVPWADVLDESDESLRPSYQLIYAHGSRRPLPCAGLRCACVKWLLRLLREAWGLKDVPALEQSKPTKKETALRALQRTLITPWCEKLEVAAQGVQDTANDIGVHPTLMLNLNAPDADTLSAQASEALFDALLVYESLEFKALCEMYEALPESEQMGIKEYVTVGTSTDKVLPDDIAAEVAHVLHRDRHAGEGGDTTTEEPTQNEAGDTVAVARMLLMLRGLLGHGLLFYGLGRRPQVHFGKDPKRPKKVAVPFRAHNKPDPRSDFASADTALLLTHLTYFYLGLTSDELKEAVQQLQRLPRGRQESIYRTWYTTARLKEHTDPALIGKTASSLNLDHEQQWSVLKKYFSFNAEVISFWLEFCVVPRDMMQFPARLMATPWTLADVRASRHRVGFSGTDDTHLLMPDTMLEEIGDTDTDNASSNGYAGVPSSCLSGQVDKASPLKGELQHELEALVATSAHMDRILVQQNVILLPDDGRTPRWEALLTLASEDAAGNIDAILDAGALLAGATAERAAEWLCKKTLAKRHDGVMYWQDADQTSGKHDSGWYVMERSGRQLPRWRSPLRDDRCFVIFSQAQCRGQDLKLRANACALLTLGRQLPQDALKQAAGRLRQLGEGKQTCIYVMPPDVEREVRQIKDQHATERERYQLSPTDALSPIDVLLWARANTIQSVAANLWPRVLHSIHYADVTLGGKMPDIPELLGLAELYAKERLTRPLVELVEERLQRRKATQPGGQRALNIAALETHTNKFGMEVEVETKQEEEVEREEEQEKEQEQQVEREIVALKPREEVKWAYKSALTAVEVRDLVEVADVCKLRDLCSYDFAQLSRWCDDDAQLYFSRNFFRTTENEVAGGNDSDAATNNILRPVEWVLWFSEVQGSPVEVVVITGQEACGILRAAQLLQDPRLEPDVQEGSGEQRRHLLHRPLWLVSLPELRRAFDQGWRGECKWPCGPGDEEDGDGDPSLFQPQIVGGSNKLLSRRGTTEGLPSSKTRWGSPEVVAVLLARLQLLNGGSVFGPSPDMMDDPRFGALRDKVLTTKEARSVASHVSEMVGKGALYATSHLQAVCQSLTTTPVSTSLSQQQLSQTHIDGERR
jgi:hypothetical protein